MYVSYFVCVEVVDLLMPRSNLPSCQLHAILHLTIHASSHHTASMAQQELSYCPYSSSPKIAFETL